MLSNRVGCLWGEEPANRCEPKSTRRIGGEEESEVRHNFISHFTPPPDWPALYKTEEKTMRWTWQVTVGLTTATVASRQSGNKSPKCQTCPLLGSLEKVPHHPPASSVCSQAHLPRRDERPSLWALQISLRKTSRAENVLFKNVLPLFFLMGPFPSPNYDELWQVKKCSCRVWSNGTDPGAAQLESSCFWELMWLKSKGTHRWSQCWCAKLFEYCYWLLVLTACPSSASSPDTLATWTNTLRPKPYSLLLLQQKWSE